MAGIRVHRSPLRQFLLGLTGLMLLVAAIDIVWTHNISLDPEKDEASGQRTPEANPGFGRTSSSGHPSSSSAVRSS